MSETVPVTPVVRLPMHGADAATVDAAHAAGAAGDPATRGAADPHPGWETRGWKNHEVRLRGLRGRGPRASDGPSARQTLVQAFGMVVAFWWLATGLVIAAQHDAATRLGAAIVSGALAIAGLVIVARSRTDATPAGARRALAGAGLLWTWVTVSLYAGWLVGPAPIRPSPDAPRVVEAMLAIRALLWHELGSIVVLAAAWGLTRRGPNRAGFHVLLAFWATTQLAKLNVFAGVANPGDRFLPPWLSFISWYVGPRRNTLLLAVSIAALAAGGYVAARKAARSRDPFARWAGAMVACMLALGALEHVFLGIPWNLPLWDVFLKVRGG